MMKNTTNSDNVATDNQQSEKKKFGRQRAELTGMDQKEADDIADETLNTDESDSGSSSGEEAGLDENSNSSQDSEMYQKRTNLYKSQMSKSRSALKKQNSKKVAANSSNQSNRHINKYQDVQQQPTVMFDDQVNDGESQIVIDIGYLKEIDTSPQNIKQLSKMLGQQIETMLNSEIKKFGVDTTPPSKSKKPRTLNQQVSDSLKNVLKVDITQQSNLSNTVGSQIRDEKFSLETFYS